MSRAVVSALVVLAAGCGDDGSGQANPMLDAPTDGQIVDARLDAPMIDAPMIDAPMPIDAAMSAITTTCMNACSALGVCFMDSDPSCVGGCSADLADCTAQQVQDINACTTLACGDQNASPIVDCIAAVTCVQM